MSFDRCSPKGVLGDIVGAESLKDPTISQEVLESLDGEGLASFVARNARETEESLDGLVMSAEQGNFNEQRSYWQKMQREFSDEYQGPDGGKVQQASIASIFQETATPSSVLGFEIIDQIDDVSMRLLQEGIIDGAKYKQAMDQVFSDIDTSEFTPSQQIYFEKYKADRYNGLLMRRSKSKLIGKVDNLSKGAVIANPTVLMGNFVEPVMKGIPLYKGNFFKGLKNLINERGATGLFDEIPELKQQGLYGLDIGDVSPNRGMLERFAGVMDRPSKNLMYYVGMAAEGTELGGRRAIQNVLFLPTLANTPLVYRNPESRAGVRLLSYSIGTMQLFHDVIKSAVTSPSPDSISRAAGLLGMYGAVTGIPYYLKSQGEDVGDIPVIGGVWKTAAGVSGVNLINRIGIPFSIFNTTVLKPISSVGKVFSDPDDLEAKDYWNMAAALTYMASGANSATENLVGNNQFRKGVKTSIEVVTGEKEAGEAFTQAFVPGFRED